LSKRTVFGRIVIGLSKILSYSSGDLGNEMQWISTNDSVGVATELTMVLEYNAHLQSSRKVHILEIIFEKRVGEVNYGVDENKRDLLNSNGY
jgi:hypothetical protein